MNAHIFQGFDLMRFQQRNQLRVQFQPAIARDFVRKFATRSCGLHINAKNQRAAIGSIVQIFCLLDHEYAIELGAIARAKVHDEVLSIAASKNVFHDKVLAGKHDSRREHDARQARSGPYENQ